MKKRPVWTYKGKVDLFETFAAELQEFSESGKLPECCDRELRYCMQLQKARRDEKGITVKYKFLPCGEFAVSNMQLQGHKDENYISRLCVRTCCLERSVYKGESKIATLKETQSRGLFQTLTYCQNREMLSNEEYVCPNCGTNLKMDEAFPMVTNFYIRTDGISVEKKIFGKLLLYIIILLLIAVSFIAFFTGHLADMFVACILLLCILMVGKNLVERYCAKDLYVRANGLYKKFEQQMKEYSSDFSLTQFTGRAISMLRVLMYAKDVEKIPFYTGEAVGDIFEDIVDAHLRAPLWIKKFRLEGNNCYVTVNVYMDVLYAAKGIRRRNEVFRLVLCRDVTNGQGVTCATSKVYCKNCDNGFDATGQGDALNSGTEFEAADNDWVVVSVEKR